MTMLKKSECSHNLNLKWCTPPGPPNFDTVSIAGIPFPGRSTWKDVRLYDPDRLLKFVTVVNVQLQGWSVTGLVERIEQTNDGVTIVTIGVHDQVEISLDTPISVSVLREYKRTEDGRWNSLG